MKRITFCLALILGIVVTSKAQIHVELGPSFQSPSGDFGEVYDFGVGFSLEPRITFDKLGVGLYGAALGFAGGNVAGTNVAAMTMTPILATGTYKLVKAPISPYVGIGAGVYSYDFASSAGVASQSDFGFMARGGVFLSRFNLGVAYHNAGDATFISFGLGTRIGPW